MVNIKSRGIIRLKKCIPGAVFHIRGGKKIAQLID